MDIHDVSIMSFLIYKQTHPNTYKRVLLNLTNKYTDGWVSQAASNCIKGPHPTSQTPTDTFQVELNPNRLEFEHWDLKRMCFFF